MTNTSNNVGCHSTDNTQQRGKHTPHYKTHVNAEKYHLSEKPKLTLGVFPLSLKDAN